MNLDEGVGFHIKNQIRDAMLTGIHQVAINGAEIPLDSVFIRKNGSRLRADMIDADNAVCFPLGENIEIHASIAPLHKNREHHVSLSFETDPFGRMKRDAMDTVCLL